MNDYAEASVYARGVAEETNIWGMQAQADLTRMIVKGVKETGMSYENYALFMVDQWKEYRASITELVYTFQTASRFFQSNSWHDSNLWPWRTRQAGVQAQSEASPEMLEWIEEYRKKHGLGIQ